jgi:hypothetical protein
MIKSAPTAALTVGVVLLAASFVAPWSIQGAWSEEDAQRWSEAAAQLHEAAHARGHQHATSTEPQTDMQARYEQAKANFESQDTKLRSKRDRIASWTWLLRGCGIASLVAGVCMFYVARVRGS